MINLGLPFCETAKLCSKVVGTFDIPIKKKILVSSQSGQYLFIKEYLIVGFMYISLITNDVEHFYVPIYHKNIYSGDMHVKILEFLNFYIFN